MPWVEDNTQGVTYLRYLWKKQCHRGRTEYVFHVCTEQLTIVRVVMDPSWRQKCFTYILGFPKMSEVSILGTCRIETGQGSRHSYVRYAITQVSTLPYGHP